MGSRLEVLAIEVYETVHKVVDTYPLQRDTTEGTEGSAGHVEIASMA